MLQCLMGARVHKACSFQSNFEPRRVRACQDEVTTTPDHDRCKCTDSNTCDWNTSAHMECIVTSWLAQPGMWFVDSHSERFYCLFPNLLHHTCFYSLHCVCSSSLMIMASKLIIFPSSLTPCQLVSCLLLALHACFPNLTRYLLVLLALSGVSVAALRCFNSWWCSLTPSVCA